MSIEITDEMVDRAGRAWFPADQYEPEFHRSSMRRVLQAALNPPPEPEIVITQEMGSAGKAVALMWQEKGGAGTSDLWVMARDMYRAMRRLEPKPKTIGDYIFWRTNAETGKRSPVRDERKGERRKDKETARRWTWMDNQLYPNVRQRNYSDRRKVQP